MLLVAGAVGVLLGSGCEAPAPSPSTAAAPTRAGEAPAGSVEDLLAKIDAFPKDAATATLYVPQSLTLKGQPVDSAIGMAVVGDRILSRQLWPNGFEQRPAGRLYRYTNKEPE
jgi:hypothetical protein